MPPKLTLENDWPARSLAATRAPILLLALVVSIPRVAMAQAGAAPDGDPDARRPAAEVLPSVLPLEVRCRPQGSFIGHRSRGTGTIVGASPARRTLRILTAAHVVECSAPPLVVGYLPDASDPGRCTSARAGIVSQDPLRDLAVLELRAPAGTRASVLVTSDLSASAPAAHPRVAALGVVAEAEPLRAGQVSLPGCGSWSYRYSRGTLRRVVRTARVGTGLSTRRPPARLHLGRGLLHDAPIIRGQSGGPLLDEDGNLLGIHLGLAVGPDRALAVALAPSAPGSTPGLGRGGVDRSPARPLPRPRGRKRGRQP